MAKYEKGEIVKLLGDFFIISNTYMAWDVQARTYIFLYDLISIKKESEYSNIPEQSLNSVSNLQQEQVLLLFT